MVGVTAVPLASVALQSSRDISGTDVTAPDGPGVVLRVVWALAALVCLAVPLAVVILARRTWLGWLLVALVASLVVLGAGLSALGIL